MINFRSAFLFRKNKLNSFIRLNKSKQRRTSNFIDVLYVVRGRATETGQYDKYVLKHQALGKKLDTRKK